MLFCGWLIWCWCGFVGCLAFHWVWYLVQWASMFSLAVCGYRWFLGCLWVFRIGRVCYYTCWVFGFWVVLWLVAGLVGLVGRTALPAITYL